MALKTQHVELPEATALEYDMPGVLCEMNDKRGRVINSWVNRQLSGQVVVQWSRESFTARGGFKNKRGQTVLPIESAIMQDRAIAGTALIEITDLAGSYDEEGMFMPGRIDELGRHSWMLKNWKEADEDRRQAARDYFTTVEVDNSRATNPYKVIAGDIAKRVKTLKDALGRDNPQAVLFQLPGLEAEQEGRLRQVQRINERYVRLEVEHSQQWQADIQALGKARDVALEYRSTAAVEDYQNLRIALKGIKYYVQPGNQFAKETLHKYGGVDDPTSVDTLISGLDLMLYRHFLSRHAYKLQSMKRDASPDRVEKRMNEIASAMETVESLELQGPYRVLVGRVLNSCQLTRDFLRAKDITAAQKVASETEALVNEHCLPKDDPEVETWYRYQP